MTAPDKLNTPNHLPSRSFIPEDWQWYAFLVLVAFACSLPAFLLPIVGAYWAAAIAIAVTLVWFSTMPTTCFGGGLGFSVIAMAMLVNTIGMIAIAFLRLVGLFHR